MRGLLRVVWTEKPSYRQGSTLTWPLTLRSTLISPLTMLPSTTRHPLHQTFFGFSSIGVPARDFWPRNGIAQVDCTSKLHSMANQSVLTLCTHVVCCVSPVQWHKMLYIQCNCFYLRKFLETSNCSMKFVRTAPADLFRLNKEIRYNSIILNSDIWSTTQQPTVCYAIHPRKYLRIVN